MQSDALHHLGDLVADLEDHGAVDDVALSETYDTLGKVTLTLTLNDTPYESAERTTLCGTRPVRDFDYDFEFEGEFEIDADEIVDELEEADQDETASPSDDPGEDGDDDTEATETVEDEESVLKEGLANVDPQRHAIVNDHADVDGDNEVTLHIPTDEDGPVECWYVDEGDDVIIGPSRVSAPTSICSACAKRADEVPEWAQDAIIDDEADDEDDLEDDETAEVSDDVDAGQSGGNTDTAGDVDEPAPVSGSSGKGNTRSIHIAAPDGEPLCESIEPEKAVSRSVNYLQYHEPSLCSRCDDHVDELPSWVEHLADDDEDDEDAEDCWCLRCGDGPFKGTSGVRRHSSHNHGGIVPMTVTHEPDEDELRGEPSDSLDDVGADDGGVA